MKIKIIFKDPDALQECVADGVRQKFERGDMSDEEASAVLNLRETHVLELAEKWFQWGEYLKVEIDTEAETCTVIPTNSPEEPSSHLTT
jgi:hypothetical protein